MNDIAAVEVKAYHQAIKHWYAIHGRKDLPWRNTNSAYEVYVSEVMLQQTQVQTVLDRYYFPFLEAFPTLAALATASLEDVLKRWEGLGYYSRARNLHKAAELAAPTLPDTVEGLQGLPGIGKNTAHAIAAFAYHQPVAVMEANVKRVLHRVLAQERMNENALWEAAHTLVDTDHPFIYNQAMMDIGATLCKVTKPHCLICPIANYCQGKDAPHLYPAKTFKKQVPVRERIIIVFHCNNRYYAAPRTTRFLGGLYGFAEYMPDAKFEFEETCYALQDLRFLGDVRQTYSHFILQASVYSMQTDGIADAAAWFTKEELCGLPLSRADQKILQLL